ncbi:putative reverse transcriptase domain-containing protein [Tanacetum coccineum]
MQHQHQSHQALIDQGVAAAMAEAEASRVRNGYNSNGLGLRPAQTARECSYSEFLKCKPLDFKGTEGVIGLIRWFEKMESVFSISNCPATSQVKFATCTLQDDALTWWNAHVKTTTPEAAHAMSWAALKKMMTDKYCPRGEIKKIETEMMFPEEIDKIEKYIGGLTLAERKRKYDDLSKNNQNQQNKRQNAGQAYTAGNSGRKSYAGIVEADLQMPTTTITTTTTIIRRATVAMSAELKKIVRIPWRNKTLIIHGDGSNQGNVTRLNIISCTKAQKYMEKGFPIFLAHITAKEVEDKSEKKRTLREYQ